MIFADLPLHSWFFLSEDSKFPKYKSSSDSFQGWNITWDTSINPEQEIFEAVFDKQERIYVNKCILDTSVKKTTKEWGRF